MNRKIIIGAILLIMGVSLLELTTWWWSLALFGLVGWVIVYGNEDFKKIPKHIYYIPLGAIAYLILGALVSFLAQSIGLNWTSNPASGQLGTLFLMIPIMLAGEEFLGIGILKSSNTYISALIFALIHIPTYWDGSILSTVLHVVLLQGVARLIFNEVYKRTESIYGSWISHCLVDYIALI